jgi:drug/metabolite transporter (DMT)-like permease
MSFLALILPLLGAIGFGTSNALSKITGQAVGTVRGVVLQTIFSTVWLALVLIFFWDSSLVSAHWILITLAMAVYGYFPLLFFIKAIKKGKVGVVIPIVDASVVVSVLCAFVFLGEFVSVAGLGFMALILLGVLLLSFNIRDFRNSHVFDPASGVPYAVLAATLWGIGFFMWNFPVRNLGPFLTSILIEFGVLMTALVHVHLRGLKLTTIPSNIWLWGVLIGFCSMLGTLGVNLGIQNVGTPITMGILGARPAFSAIVGYVMFGEKLAMKQLLSIALIMVGVVGLAIVK